MKILWNKIRSNLWNSKWLNTWKEHSIILANYVPAQGAELNSFLLIWTCFLFLSDTGTTPPESGIFGFMINFSAFLGKYTVKRSEVKSLSCVQLCNPMDCGLPGYSGVGCHFLLQGIVLTQGVNPGIPRCRQTLYCLSH